MTFDSSKPVQTRDGRSARIICADAKVGDTVQIIALIMQPNGDEYENHYSPEGVWSDLKGRWDHNDLINIPETHEVVVYLQDIYSRPRPEGFEAFMTNASGKAIASKRITFTVGEFED